MVVGPLVTDDGDLNRMDSLLDEKFYAASCRNSSLFSSVVVSPFGAFDRNPYWPSLMRLRNRASTIITISPGPRVEEDETETALSYPRSRTCFRYHH